MSVIKNNIVERKGGNLKTNGKIGEAVLERERIWKY